MSRVNRFLLLMLLLLVLVVFARAITCDFTNWDDPETISQNPRLNPPTWAALRHHWVHADMDIYIPVTRTVWAVTAIFAQTYHPDPAGIRLNPYLFHLVNVLAHLLSTAVVFSILKLLVPSPAAFIGAAIFAIHPVMVEPVAWLSGLKDVLCGTLSLIALRVWLAPTGSLFRMRNTVLAAVFYALALLSKPSAVSLPVVAGVIAVVALGWTIQHTLLRLLPWIVLAIPVVILAHHWQPASTLPPVLLVDRPLIAVDALFFYLMKLGWPLHLGIDYGHTPQAVISKQRGVLTVIAIALLLAAALMIHYRRRYPLLVAGAMVFVAALIPTLGFVPFNFQAVSTVADHYLYVAMLGPAMLVAALIARLPKNVAYPAATVVIACLSLRTFFQIGNWTDSVSLMSHAIAVNPTSYVGHLNLSMALLPDSPAAAIDQLQITTRLYPTAIEGFEDLGTACINALRFEQAISAYRRWVALSPRDPAAWTALAAALGDNKQMDQSIAAYEQALKLDPDRPAACVELAKAFEQRGQWAKAAELYQKAIQRDPSMGAAKTGLAKAGKRLAQKDATQP